eukprot:1153672-Pelagomonas_calceolata.AAC.2
MCTLSEGRGAATLRGRGGNTWVRCAASLSPGTLQKERHRQIAFPIGFFEAAHLGWKGSRYVGRLCSVSVAKHSSNVGFESSFGSSLGPFKPTGRNDACHCKHLLD